MPLPNDLIHRPTAIFWCVALAASAAVAQPSVPASPRFVAHGPQVLDTATGLVWTRCSEGQRWDNASASCLGEARPVTWNQALHRARDVSASTGFAWRVPNVKELASLVDDTRQAPAIDPGYFPNTPVTTYWTSTHSVYFVPEIWILWSGDGYIDTSYASFTYDLRLVRDAGPR